MIVYFTKAFIANANLAIHKLQQVYAAINVRSFMIMQRSNVAGHTAELVVCASVLKLAKKKKV